MSGEKSKARPSPTRIIVPDITRLEDRGELGFNIGVEDHAVHRRIDDPRSDKARERSAARDVHASWAGGPVSLLPAPGSGQACLVLTPEVLFLKLNPQAIKKRESVAGQP
jgi:hypothetical protein